MAVEGPTYAELATLVTDLAAHTSAAATAGTAFGTYRTAAGVVEAAVRANSNIPVSVLVGAVEYVGYVDSDNQFQFKVAQRLVAP